MRDWPVFISKRREKENGVKKKQLKDSLNNNFFQKEKFVVNKSINSQKINIKIIPKDSIKKVSNIKYIYNNNLINNSNKTIAEGDIEYTWTNIKFYEKLEEDSSKEKRYKNNYKRKKENNHEIKRRYMKNKSNKLFTVYFYDIILNIIILSLFIKCNSRKIINAYSYINLKIKGTNEINIYFKLFPGIRPNVIIINNKINYTNSAINHTYNLESSENIINNISNITLIWDNPLSHTDSLFRECENIIEIDFSNFDSSKVTRTDYMFCGCKSLISLDLSNFNTSNVTDMGFMFYKCASLSFLDLSSFDTSKVTNMKNMFSGCLSLNPLNLTNFNTAFVKSMDYMFSGCLSLTSLDLSNFNTSNATNMDYLFSGCSSLTSLDLSNFNISSVTTLSHMFSNCLKINSLDLSYFNTSKVNDMSGMFYGCHSLTSLDISNFVTSNVTNMGYMFHYCVRLSSLNLSNFVTSNVTDMGYMFHYCGRLSSLDLSSFDTSNVTSMKSMFNGCSLLASLDLSNLDTSNVTDMEGMFFGCLKLTSLDLSNFNTSNVTSTKSMFFGCSSLTSLDLSNFDTSNVTTMYSMFNGCRSIKSLDLSNFDTSNVIMMQSMFNGCSSLTSLDLSNFDTSNVTDMEGMFNGCSSLTSLDISNFNTSYVTTMSGMFYGCSSLTSLNLSNFNTSQVRSLDCIFYNCEKLEYVNLKIAKINPSITFSGECSNHPQNLTICSKEEEWSRIFDLSIINNINCINNISYFNVNETINKMKCFTKNNIGLENPCQICDKNYLEKNVIINSISYIICYEYKEGYYFDDNTLNYKPCYSSCKKCNISGNETGHNCIECKEDYNFEFNYSIYKNCFMNLINDSETIMTETEKEIEFINNTGLIEDILSRLNKSNIDSGNDKIIFRNNISMIITSTKNQKKNVNENIITIDLCKCEYILKNEYNISYNDSLYILLYIIEEEGMKIPKVEYEVYYPFLYNNIFTKLNLTLCKETKIEISIPVKINDNIDKHNPKSGYYNDICYKTTSEIDTDICLKDRRNEFIENNMTLCEENCDLINYNYAIAKVKCSCDFQTNISQNHDIKFNKKEFFKSFTDIKNIANIDIIKCYKIVFIIKNLIYNYGFYIMAFIMLLYFIAIIIFCCISYKN